MNAVTPRVGPANAIGLMKDANLAAFRQLFIELGISEAHVEEVIKTHLTKTAQNILKMPMPSPIQKL